MLSEKATRGIPRLHFVEVFIAFTQTALQRLFDSRIWYCQYSMNGSAYLDCIHLKQTHKRQTCKSKGRFSNHLPKGPLPNTITLGIRFKNMNLGVGLVHPKPSAYLLTFLEKFSRLTYKYVHSQKGLQKSSQIVRDNLPFVSLLEHTKVKASLIVQLFVFIILDPLSLFFPH